MRYQNSEAGDLGDRTTEFALRVVKVFRSLPRNTESHVMGKQMLRSGTSVGAHIAESRRAKSPADFVSKVEGAMGELEETRYWFTMPIRSSMVPENKLSALIKESDEIMAIIVTIVHKTRIDEND